MNWIMSSAVRAATISINKAGKYFVWVILGYLLAAFMSFKNGRATLDIDPIGDLLLMASKLWLILQAIVWHGPPVGETMHQVIIGDVPENLVVMENGRGVVALARLLGLWVMFLIWFAAFLALLVTALRIIQETVPKLPKILSPTGGRFAHRTEVIAAQTLEGAAFGHYRDEPLVLNTDKHVLIMASTRSGKGVALIIPHLLRYRGSAFVLDPKGENARATHRHRGELNDAVLFLDPFGISGQPQARFNPLSRFTPENMEAESKALAAALVLGEGTRDHWTGSAQQLLAAFIMHVFSSDAVPAEGKDLPTVRRLLLGDVTGTLKKMEQSTVADGLLADLARSFLKTPEGEFGSIVSTAQRETEILDNPNMIRCLSAAGEGEEVDFSAWHRGTMTVYLCLAAPKFPVFNRWLRLVLTAALDEMTDTLNPPPLPVCFMLDELATLGHLAVVENAVGLAAGYGVQIYAVFQDTAQMRDLYKARWASFIGNAGIRVLFNLDDYDTASYWSKFIGSHEVETRNRQRDAFGLVHGESTSQAIRPALPPEELMQRYASGKMLVLRQGSRPIEAVRVPYFDDTTLVGLWDDPRGPLPEASPAAARRAA